MATETSSAVGNGYVKLGGTVDTVLSSPRIAPPPATLEEARNQPGRRERIEELTRRIESDGIKYVFFQQVSITGRVMGKGVVASFFPQVAEKGYQLVYGATANLFTDRHGNYIGFGPEESELAAMADLDTFAILPWEPRVARVFCDCYDTETGELLEADPRQNLKRTVNEVERELGLTFLCGIEPEMMWLKKSDDPNKAEGITKPWCYHINQFEELRPIILDVIDYGEQLGIHPTYGDHEDSPGQLELNFLFDRALRTADNLSTYRQICAAVARKHDVIATFMPKPFAHLTGNGCHFHMSLWKDGQNVFEADPGDDPNGMGLSETAYNFIGGLKAHAKAYIAVTAPTVTSYKRLVTSTTLSGSTWAPVYISYGYNNRTQMLRIPAAGRIEDRTVDGSCNPYLAATVILAAGLDGIEKGLPAGDPTTDLNLHELNDDERNDLGVEMLPATLLDAARELEKDDVLRDALGHTGREDYIDYFARIKKAEFKQAHEQITQWELDRYLQLF